MGRVVSGSRICAPASCWTFCLIGLSESFPEYETMLRIADYFHVEIGYLTGETDGKSYDAQKTADYLRLSIEAIDSIKQVTDRSSSRGKTTISRKPRPMLASRMYEKLLTAEGFYPFLAQMEELDMEYNSPLTKKEWSLSLSSFRGSLKRTE